ncbi:adenosylhomocysteinase [Lachnospiraceae bacterium KM106-2]|nr:adenosylhomocysteinase [Lachnospiraceae bacterium KM106-2]
MRKLREKISNYIPFNEQEETEKQLMIKYMDQFDDLLTRENEMAHFTASSWIVNEDYTKVLMIYHNIYQSWAWTGGHADGDADLLHVALKEAREETGLKHVKPLDDDIFSLEILGVNGHIKRGSFVGTHLHLNVTYLLQASEEEFIRIKEDENSNIGWVPREEAAAKSSEPYMQGIYQKLNEKLEKKQNKL